MLGPDTLGSSLSRSATSMLTVSLNIVTSLIISTFVTSSLSVAAERWTCIRGSAGTTVGCERAVIAEEEVFVFPVGEAFPLEAEGASA